MKSNLQEVVWGGIFALLFISGSFMIKQAKAMEFQHCDEEGLTCIKQEVESDKNGLRCAEINTERGTFCVTEGICIKEPVPGRQSAR